MLQVTDALEERAQDGPSSRKLRILHVSPTYYPAVRYGGPIRSVHALARALVGRGHDVHVFTSSMDGPLDLDVPLGASVNLDGVQVRYFRVPFLRRLCRCPALREAVRAQAPHFDVMHLHSVFLWPTWAAARAARSAGLPYLVSPRGMLGSAVIHGKSRMVKSAWIRLIEQQTLIDSAGIHVTAELERDEILALGLRTPDIICVPNGVSWPSTPPTLASGPFAALPRPYALFLSRIDWKKGLDRLIKAWKWVPHLSLIIAGNDESGYREKLERIVEEYQLEGRIHFIGAVSDEHKWALYDQATMFVLPSYSENFGNVVAEAMAMGCPVVVTPEVGLARLVRESGAGIVTDGSPQRLAETIRTLMHDSAARRLMGDRGRAAARQQLSWESAAGRMEALYRDVCSGRAGRHAVL
jgi:glycosyltransferase involved in cell wall biosynthesis